MKLRHLLVAASAAAVLAGTSMGAQAGNWSFSKGSSSSGVLSLGIIISSTPVAGTLQIQHNDSVAMGPGSGAAANAGTTGGATAGTYNYSYTYNYTDTKAVIAPNSQTTTLPSSGSGNGSGSGVYTTAGGSTSGASCAGSGCN
jgi:hypothetical protein